MTSLAQQSESMVALLARLAADPLRPQFHLLPPAGFLGDPCAPRFFEGSYHAFFHGSYGGRGWHHAISPDLVHWRHMPIALTPTAGGYDSYGTFTGGVLPGTGDIGTVVYTGVTKVPREKETIRNEGLREVQCIATSSQKDLAQFDKLPKAVIDGPPDGMKVTGFRDPFGWKDGDTWYVGVGSGFNKFGGALLLYRSKDARSFEYVHALAEGTWNGLDLSNPVGSAEMWECPDFFPIGEKHVLLYSTEYKTYWEVGTFDKEALKFHSEQKGKLDYGNYYAPRSMPDSQGRRILWGWVQESRPAEAIKAAGWSGAMSLPRVLSIGSDGGLQITVAKEMNQLLSEPKSLRRTDNSKSLAEQLESLALPGRSGRIVWSIQTGKPCALNLALVASGKVEPLLSVNHDGNTERPSITVDDRVLPLHPDGAGVSRLELWLDGSVLELFVDGREVLTTRCYTFPNLDPKVTMTWTGLASGLRTLSRAIVRPISPDRLASAI
jgi:beta-fructofuranosidase